MKKLFIVLISILFICFIYNALDYKVLKKNSEITYNEGNKDEFFIYVINLPEAQNRRDFILPMVKKLGINYKIIDAIKGDDLSQEFLDTNFDSKAFHEYVGAYPRKSEVGCYFSHVNVWQEFLKSDYKYALILEDDIVMPVMDLRNILISLPKYKDKWDIFQIDRSHYGMPKTIVRLVDHHKLSYYLKEVTRTSAYAINKHAAAKLLEHAFPMKLAVDRFFTRGWEMDFKFAGLKENINRVYFGDSHIEKIKPVIDKDFEHYVFRAKSRIARFYHNLLLYIKNS